MADRQSVPAVRDGLPDVIAPNLKRRLSGVTSTIIQLVPAQRAAGIDIAAFGPGLPADMPRLRCRDLPGLWRRPTHRRFRIWHARRNTEMLAGIVLRDVLRMPLKLIFTSAAQRRHTAYTKWLIRRMDAVVATSDISASFLDVPNIVIMHGIDTARFAPPIDRRAAKAAVGLDPDRRHVGCSGRVRHSKGTDIFVDAMIEALPRHPQWTAIVTGRTTPDNLAYRRGMEQRIAAAGLTGRIVFVGEVPDIVPWFQAFDLQVAPSRNEGFGLTPLETMATGLPVIATDAGAYRILIAEGKTGFVVSDFEPATLAAAADRLMGNDGLRCAMGEAALRHVRSNHSLDDEVAALGALYERLAPRE